MTATTTLSLPSTTVAHRRFGYMTGSVENLHTARKLALSFGSTVDMLPLDAPTPESDAYDGIMVDFAPAARHMLARKSFLDKLSQMAKVFPVVVFDPSTNYQEAARMRAAGIKWLPVLRAKAFEMMIAHPLTKRNSRKSEPETEIELCEESSVTAQTE